MGGGNSTPPPPQIIYQTDPAMQQQLDQQREQMEQQRQQNQDNINQMNQRHNEQMQRMEQAQEAQRQQNQEQLNYMKQKAAEDRVIHEKQLDFQREQQQVLQQQLTDIKTESERQREQFEQREKKIHDQLNKKIQKLKAENIQSQQEYDKRMDQIKAQSEKRLNELEKKREREKKEHDVKIKQLAQQNAKEIQKLSNDNLRARMDSIHQIITGELARYQDKKDQVTSIYQKYRNELIQILKEERRLRRDFSEEIDDPTLLNVVLLGITGHGKSALACRLAGDRSKQCDSGYFKHNDNLVSVTQGIKKRVAKGIWDRNISVTDTPGIFDSTGRDREHANNLIEFLKGCGGVNAFILVKTQIPPRFDESFQNVLDTLQVLLADEFWRYCVVCITHVDRYERQSQKFQSYKQKLQRLVRQKIDKTADEAPLPCIGIDSISNWKDPIKDLLNIVRKDRFNCDNLRSPLQELKVKSKATEKEFENKKKELDGIKQTVNTAYQQYQECDKLLHKNDANYISKPIDLSLMEQESKDEWDVEIEISDEDEEELPNDVYVHDVDDEKIAENNQQHQSLLVDDDVNWKEMKTEHETYRLKEFDQNDEVSLKLEDKDCNPPKEVIKLDKMDNRYDSFKYIIQKAEDEGDDCIVTVQYKYFKHKSGDTKIETAVNRVEVGDIDDE